MPMYVHMPYHKVLEVRHWFATFVGGLSQVTLAQLRSDLQSGQQEVQQLQALLQQASAKQQKAESMAKTMEREKAALGKGMRWGCCGAVFGFEGFLLGLRVLLSLGRNLSHERRSWTLRIHDNIHR